MSIKKFYIAITACFCFSYSQAQETTASVEKSIFNIQTGLVGFWGSHEARLSNTIALRTEVGFDLWYYETYRNSIGERDKGVALVPSIALEPRWYYNIKKRANKGRHIANNSASFLTVAIEYYPDLFKIGGPDYLYVPNQISFIPKWGIRRSIAKSNFNYEAGIGLGYLLYLDKDNPYRDQSDVAVDIHVRIGYTF